MQSNETSVNASLMPFYTFQVYIFTSILSIMFAFGIVANTITIYVIASTKLRRSTFNIFLLSLCFSDFMSAMISPLFIYRRTWGYETWHIPNVFCKLFFGFDQWTSVVTAAHITTFAILRLISIRWPHTFGKITVFHAKAVILLLWLISFAVGCVPFMIFCGIVHKEREAPKTGNAWPTCSLLIAWLPQFKIYAYVAYTLLFYVPILCVTFVSTLIAVLLWRRRKTREQQRALSLQGRTGHRTINQKDARKDRQAMIQLMLIVGSFLIGYMPHIVYHFYSSNTKPSTQAMRNLDWVFGMAEYSCLRFTECLNPVIYNMSSSKIRKETFRILGHCKRCSLGARATESNRKIVQPVVCISPRNGIPLQSTSRSSLSA